MPATATGRIENSAVWALRLCLASGTAQRLWMSIAGSSSLRRLRDAALIMHLHELAAIGGRAADHGEPFQRKGGPCKVSQQVVVQVHVRVQRRAEAVEKGDAAASRLCGLWQRCVEPYPGSCGSTPRRAKRGTVLPSTTTVSARAACYHAWLCTLS